KHPQGEAVASLGFHFEPAFFYVEPNRNLERGAQRRVAQARRLIFRFWPRNSMSSNLPSNSNPSALPVGVEAGFESVDLSVVKPEESAMALLPGDFALKNQVLPMRIEGASLVVAIGSVASLAAVDDLSILLGRPIHPVLGDAQIIRDKIEEYFLEKMLSGMA